MNSRQGYVIAGVVAIILLAIIGYSVLRNSKQNKQSDQTSTITNNSASDNSSIQPTSTASEQTAVVKSDSYAYDNVILSYEKNPKLQNPDDYVTVYITESGKKTELVKEVPIDIPGGSMPEFKKTSNPNIALLTISSGDSGGFFSRSYFIDITGRNIVSVTNTNGSTLEVTNADNQISKIALLINDTCGKGENRKDGATAILKDITVNNHATSVVKQAKTLTCVNPGGIGAIYEPSPTFDFVGVSNDLSKVYFSLSGNSFKNGQQQVVWKNNISFDIKAGTVKEETPANTL